MRPHVVVAGAGSGKTQTMGLRVVWLVANGLVDAAPDPGPDVHPQGRCRARRARAPHAPRASRSPTTESPFLTDAGPPAAHGRAHRDHLPLLRRRARGRARAAHRRSSPTPGWSGTAVSWQYAAQVVESYDGDMEAVDRVLTRRPADVLALAGETVRAPARRLGGRGAQRAGPARTSRPCRARTGSGPRATTPTSLTWMRSPGRPGPAAPPRRALHRAEALARGDGLRRPGGVRGPHRAASTPRSPISSAAGFGLVLLDEYQDTGEAQRVLLTALFGRGHPVTAVGDPWQSIYGWRVPARATSSASRSRLPARDGCRPAHERLDRQLPQRRDILGAANPVAGALPVRGRAEVARSTPGPAAASGAGDGSSRCTRPRRRGDLGRGEIAALGTAGAADAPPWGRDRGARRGGARSPRRGGAAEPAACPSSSSASAVCSTTPEVVDLVATLRALPIPAAGAALLRLLTGARWRLGPRDLVALRNRARYLAGGAACERRRRPRGTATESGTTASRPARGPGRRRGRGAQPGRRSRRPGRASAYSAEGHRRVGAADRCGGCGGGPRRRCPTSSWPRGALDLDVELAPAPACGPPRAATSTGSSRWPRSSSRPGRTRPWSPSCLPRGGRGAERGLDGRGRRPDAERVQLMTVHAAKGLEWDGSSSWGCRRRVPRRQPPRGRLGPRSTRSRSRCAVTATTFPVLDWSGATDQMAATRARGFTEACGRAARWRNGASPTSR